MIPAPPFPVLVLAYFMCGFGMSIQVRSLSDTQDQYDRFLRMPKRMVSWVPRKKTNQRDLASYMHPTVSLQSPVSEGSTKRPQDSVPSWHPFPQLISRARNIGVFIILSQRLLPSSTSWSYAMFSDSNIKMVCISYPKAGTEMSIRTPCRRRTRTRQYLRTCYRQRLQSNLSAQSRSSSCNIRYHLYRCGSNSRRMDCHLHH